MGQDGSDIGAWMIVEPVEDENGFGEHHREDAELDFSRLGRNDKIRYFPSLVLGFAGDETD